MVEAAGQQLSELVLQRELWSRVEQLDVRPRRAGRLHEKHMATRACAACSHACELPVFYGLDAIFLLPQSCFRWFLF